MNILHTTIFLAIFPAFLFAQQPGNQQPKDSTSQVLQQVTVKGTTKQLVNKNGNIIANIENTPLASISNPLDLLAKLPAVQISPDENSISIIGKGQAVIYIDNQKASLDDFKSLSVADIKTIELINNPPTKYEAEGRAVIKITRKYNKKEGWKAEINQTAAQRKYFLNRLSANASFRKRKLELKANIQYNHLETWEGNAFQFNITEKNVFSAYSVTAVTKRPQYIFSTALFYQINEQDYLSVNTTARTQNEKFPILTSSYLSSPDKTESAITKNYNQQPIRNYSHNINYNKRIKKLNSTIFTGAQLTKYTLSKNSQIYNSLDNAPEQLSLIRFQQAAIDVLTARADIETQLTEKCKLDWGTNLSSAASEGNVNIENLLPATINNSIFGYKEKNTAIYSNVSGKINKLGYSAGARMENVNVQSRYNDNQASSVIIKKNTRLYPKVSATLPIDSAASLSFNYAKTVTRPNYTNANQTSVYINPYFEWANNINLNPSYTDELTSTYQYKNYSVALSLYRTRGVVYAGFNYNDQNTILRRSEFNYENEKGIYVNFNIPFTYKIWSSTNVMNITYSAIKDARALQNNTRPYLYLYTSNELRLPKKFIFTLTGWATTKNQLGAIERSGMFSVDTAFTKNFTKNLSCTLRVTDMFASMDSTEKFEVNAVAANGRYYDRLQEISLSIKYSPGKLKESAFKNKDIDENINRIR